MSYIDHISKNLCIFLKHLLSEIGVAHFSVLWCRCIVYLVYVVFVIDTCRQYSTFWVSVCGLDTYMHCRAYAQIAQKYVRGLISVLNQHFPFKSLVIMKCFPCLSVSGVRFGNFRLRWWVFDCLTSGADNFCCLVHNICVKSEACAICCGIIIL